jgi:hypothetical protein
MYQRASKAAFDAILLWSLFARTQKLMDKNVIKMVSELVWETRVFDYCSQ